MICMRLAYLKKTSDCWGDGTPLQVTNHTLKNVDFSVCAGVPKWKLRETIWLVGDTLLHEARQKFERVLADERINIETAIPVRLVWLTKKRATSQQFVDLVAETYMDTASVSKDTSLQNYGLPTHVLVHIGSGNLGKLSILEGNNKLIQDILAINTQLNEVNLTSNGLMSPFVSLTFSEMTPVQIAGEHTKYCDILRKCNNRYVRNAFASREAIRVLRHPELESLKQGNFTMFGTYTNKASLLFIRGISRWLESVRN